MKLSVKRITSTLLAVAMLLTGWSSLASAAVFKDTQGHWAQEAVEKWSESGVIKGSDGTFRPNDAVTRAEFATMIDNIVKYTETGGNGFSDLSPSKWYYDAMLKLNKAGVLKGSNGKALPGSSITRQEAAVMVAKAFNIEESEGGRSFTDESAVAAWAKGYVHALAARNIIGGMPDGSFKPSAILTRAQAVTLFGNFMQDLVSKAGDYSKDIHGNLVVNAPGAVLKDMSISGNLYITQGVGEGEVTLNNVSVAGSVYVRGGGEHSIIFNSVDVKGALVVNKNNGKIRILATGSTSVAVTQLKSGGLLVTKELTGGGFETVEITADIAAGQEIVLDGTFNKVANQSADAKITANGTIKELVAQVDTKLAGKVEIAKVTSSEGVKATVNDQAVQPTGSGGSSGAAAPVGNAPGGNAPVENNPGDNNTDPGTTTGILTLSLSKFEGANVDAAAQLDSAVLTNSGAIAISKFEKSVVRSTYYEAVVSAQDELRQTTEPAGRYFYLVATLKDDKGAAPADLSDIQVTVASATYSYQPIIGDDLAASAEAGSVVLKLDAGETASIQHYTVTVKRAADVVSTLVIDFAPQGTSYIKRIGAIAGEAAVGSELTAGAIVYEGEGAAGPVGYQWYGSNKADGAYSAISGATGEKYTVTEADSGRYLRVEATADGRTFAGSAASAAFGPIRQSSRPVEVSDFIDPYFAADYPRAYVKNGEIWVKFKLNKPADVYMVVNVINGSWKSDVDSVLEGHAGENDVIWVDQWPYFAVTESQVGIEQEFNTHRTLDDNEARIEFVVKDSGKGYLSSQVTTIRFEPEVISALDTYPPYSSETYVNKDLNAVYLYFYEKLDTGSVPAPSDFALNYGSVDRVTLVNYEGVNRYPASYIKLDVSGIPAARKNELSLSYSGSAIQDLSDAKNKTAPFVGQEVMYAEYGADKAMISSDRKAVILSTKPGWNPGANVDADTDFTNRFSVTIGGQTYKPNNSYWSYNGDEASYTLRFDEPLPAGKVTAVMDAAGLTGVAYDAYPAAIAFDDIKEIAAPGTPTVTYRDGTIKLKFADGFVTYNSSSTAAGLVLDVDGKEYALRGFIVQQYYDESPSSDSLMVNLNDEYAGLIKQAVEAGAEVRIKYTNLYKNNLDSQVLSDAARTPIPDFDYIEVSKSAAN